MSHTGKPELLERQDEQQASRFVPYCKKHKVETAIFIAAICIGSPCAGAYWKIQEFYKLVRIVQVMPVHRENEIKGIRDEYGTV